VEPAGGLGRRAAHVGAEDAVGEHLRGERLRHEGHEGRPSRMRYRDVGELGGRPHEVERRRDQEMEQARFRQADVARPPEVAAVRSLGNCALDLGSGRIRAISFSGAKTKGERMR